MESPGEKSKLFSSFSWTPLRAQVATSAPKEPQRFLFKTAQNSQFPSGWAQSLPNPRMWKGFWKSSPKQRIDLISGFFFNKLEKFLPHLFPSLSFFSSFFLLISLLRCGYKKLRNSVQNFCLAWVRSGRNCSLQECRHCGNIDSLHLHKRILIMLYHQHLWFCSLPYATVSWI